MQRKIRLTIGILIMTGLIAGCWKVSKNLQKELKEEQKELQKEKAQLKEEQHIIQELDEKIQHH